MRGASACRCSRGFTLIEALVALSIFALIGVAAYELLSSTARLQERGEARLRALGALQLTLRQLEEDFVQVAEREVPDEAGRELAPALEAQPADAVVALTRGGWRNPLGLRRARLQRVAWRLDSESHLVRRYRRSLDDADPNAQVERVFSDGIDELTIRYLDEENRWVEDWPPAPPAQANSGKPVPAPIPRAVEIRLVHELVGEVVRVVAMR